MDKLIAEEIWEYVVDTLCESNPDIAIAWDNTHVTQQRVPKELVLKFIQSALEDYEDRVL